MEVERWAKIHRLKKIENLSNYAIACELKCCSKTVAKALKMEQPPSKSKRSKKSILDPFKPKIKEIIDRYPTLSAIRVHQDIVKEGYAGEITLIKKYLQEIRLVSNKRVYLEGNYDPGQAMQVDWGSCGKLTIGNDIRKLYVFVGVLCYSRMIYIEFSLSQKNEDFYRCIANSLRFFGAVPKKIIVDNLKSAVVEGSGRNARFHNSFLALCGHYLMEPIACAKRDPESKDRASYCTSCELSELMT